MQPSYAVAGVLVVPVVLVRAAKVPVAVAVAAVRVFTLSTRGQQTRPTAVVPVATVRTPVLMVESVDKLRQVHTVMAGRGDMQVRQATQAMPVQTSPSTRARWTFGAQVVMALLLRAARQAVPVRQATGRQVR